MGKGIKNYVLNKWRLQILFSRCKFIGYIPSSLGNSNHFENCV